MREREGERQWDSETEEGDEERERENLKYLKRDSLGDEEEGAHTALVFPNAVQIAWAIYAPMCVFVLATTPNVPSFSRDLPLFAVFYLSISFFLLLSLRIL